MLMRYNYDIIHSICEQCDIEQLLAWQLVSGETHSLSAPLLYKSITVVNRKQLVLLQNALVLNPNLRPLIRRIIVQKRVISLEFRGSIQPSEGVLFDFKAIGDVDMVECLSALLIPLPNISYLEVNAPLDELCIADPYIIWAMNIILHRSLSNIVITNNQSVMVDPPRKYFFMGKSDKRLNLPYVEIETETSGEVQSTATSLFHTLLSVPKVNVSINAPNLTPNKNFDVLFPLPLDEADRYPRFDPMIPVLHWLGLDSYFSQKVGSIYHFMHRVGSRYSKWILIGSLTVFCYIFAT